MHSLLYKCPHCDAAVEVEPHEHDEITTCPRCDKPFEARVPVADPENGPLVAGPNGAAVLTAAPSRPAERAPEATEEVPADELMERTVLEVQPYMFWRYPVRYVSLVALIAAGLVGGVVGLAYGWWLLVIAGAVVLGYGLYHFARWGLRARATRLTVTNKRCILEHGILHKEKLEIQHEDLDTLHVHQDFWNRRFGTGDLGITTNSGEAGKHQVFVMALPEPQHVAETIRAQVQPAPAADEGVNATTAAPAEQV